MAPKILVVDDSKSARGALRDVLGPAGYEIVEAPNAQHALDTISAHCDFCLVLLDVNMPGKNGIQALRELKEMSGAAAKIPVVMLTTEGQPHLVREARNAGAKAWLVKPFDPTLLVAAVNKLALKI